MAIRFVIATAIAFGLCMIAQLVCYDCVVAAVTVPAGSTEMETLLTVNITLALFSIVAGMILSLLSLVVK